MANNNENDEAAITISYLNGLIKQKRDAGLISVLLNEKSLCIINKQSTFLHTAAIFDNIEVITLLFTLEFDINTRNSLGETPLLLAARKNSYQAAQLLLTLGADVFAEDFRGESALAVLLKKVKNTPTHLIASLFERLKNSELGPNGIVNILFEFGCPIEHVLMFNDAKITQKMLIRLRYRNVCEDMSCALLHSAMLSGNMENVLVLLQYGPHWHSRCEKFIEKVTKNILDPATRPFLEQVVNWDLVSPYFVHQVATFFRKANENVIELLLNIGIVEYCQEHYHKNLMINLFYNKKIDVAKVLKNRHFNVNSVDEFSITALCRAVQCGNKVGVTYLLENGADPNLKDSNGQTPIFDCRSDGMRKLLMDAGADMFVIDNAGRTIIDKNPSEHVKADYCILEVKRSMNDDVPDTPFSQNAALERYRKDLKWMKSRKISDSVSLFSVLVEKVEKTTRHVKTKNSIVAVLNATRERYLEPIFMSKLKKNLQEVIKMHKLQSKASAFLSYVMKIASPDHLAIENIISFLTLKDLKIFDRIDERR